MRKSDELSNPDSCFSKAADDEPVFVLRAKDPDAPFVVRQWALVARGKHDDDKIAEAHELADQMENWRLKQLTKRRTS